MINLILIELQAARLSPY